MYVCIIYNFYLYILTLLCMCMYLLSLCLFVAVCPSVCVLSLGRKLTRQENQKHFFNFARSYKDMNDFNIKLQTVVIEKL